jgi:hypothetical protein
MDSKKRFVRLHMAEVVAAFRACQEDTQERAEVTQNDQGLVSFAMTYEKMIQSPQLRFFDSFGVPDVEDIEMDEVPSTRLHPAGISYFFIKKRPGQDYDSRLLHPSFFGADYERESSRAKEVALGAARGMMKDMNAVVKKMSRKLPHGHRPSNGGQAGQGHRHSTAGRAAMAPAELAWTDIEEMTVPAKVVAEKKYICL